VVVERKKRVAWRMQEEEIFELSSFELVVVLASLDFDHQGATCFGCWGVEEKNEKQNPELVSRVLSLPAYQYQ